MPAPLRFYDNYTRTLRPFTPLAPGPVGLYTCGPTVYDFQHIGNFRTFLFEDVLKRVLRFNGHDVRHVMNITDVGHLVADGDDGEDKMAVGARRTGKTAWQIAEIYTEAFRADMRALNIEDPTILCRATDHIAEQVAFIADLEQKGYIYRTGDGIYFDTAKQPDYGFLARLDREGLEAGKRVDIGEKRAPTDFALWKFSPPDERRQMEWPSPWGVGFPGWHIECSAMAQKYLGDYFDIHCGGEDHIPIHHTNEIAQTEARVGTRLANFWMHGYFLLQNDAKMAKSAGEFLRVKALTDRGLRCAVLPLSLPDRALPHATQFHVGCAATRRRRGWRACAQASTRCARMAPQWMPQASTDSRAMPTTISTCRARWRWCGTCCVGASPPAPSARRWPRSTACWDSASSSGGRARTRSPTTCARWPRRGSPRATCATGPSRIACATPSGPRDGTSRIAKGRTR